MSKDTIISNVKADQDCMTKCVEAFTTLSRHHCDLHGDDSVAVGQAEKSRMRVLHWLVSYVQDHKYL